MFGKNKKAPNPKDSSADAVQKSNPKQKKHFFGERREKTYDELSAILTAKLQENSRSAGVIHNVDPVFLILFVITAGFAFIVSFSATNPYAETFYDDKYHFVWQTLFFYAVGVLLIITASILARELKYYAFFTIVGLGIALLLLILVFPFGKEAGGAKRWLEFGGATLQPSEVAKTALVLTLSLYMSIFHDKITDKKSNKNSFIYGVLFPMIPIAIICGLVYLEKHNSGTIIIAMIGLAVMFLGGTRGKWIAMLVVLGVGAVAVMLLFSEHGLDRIESFFAPKDVITDDNWQTVQGLYAISSGGIFGLGFGESRLKYGYVSQPQNDFIFPIICEELGLIGGMAVVILFLMLFLRAMKLGLNSSNLFASITICGFAVKLIIQVLLNVCVVTAIGPNTGISLPLFSAGGSAMLFQLLEFGIIIGLSRYSDVRN